MRGDEKLQLGQIFQVIQPRGRVGSTDAQRPPHRHEEAGQEEEGPRRQLALRRRQCQRQLLQQLPLLRDEDEILYPYL